MVYADRSLVTRRDFLHAGGAALVALHGFERLIPAYARTGLWRVARRRPGSPGRYELTIGQTAIDIGGRSLAGLRVDRFPCRGHHLS